MTVRVRFAPSPTGYLHIGGLRTALYNYLLARQTGGVFVLRIEDTDRKRLVEGSVKNLIESLRWAGLEFDEGPEKEGDVGPYMQSQRLELYQKYAQQLLDAGQAYYAFDTPEELDTMRKEQQAQKVASVFYDRQKMRNSLSRSKEEVSEWLKEGRPHVIRMKVPDDQKEFIVHDELRGEVRFKREHVDDQVLIKTDGFPTYHMASVVDDHHMGITHIIRGEEWISSVPKHIVLYHFFGWEVPKMIHLPLILNKDRSKLSKRQNDVAVEDYKAKGYDPRALINYMALLGWSPGDDRELFTMDELIEAFSLDRLTKSGAIFDIKKLNWFNAQYLRETPVERLAEEAQPILEQAGFSIPSTDYLHKVIGLLQERMTVLTDIVELGSYFFQDPTSYDEKTCKKRWKDTSAMLAKTYADKLEQLNDFNAETAEQTLKQLAEDKGVKAGALLLPARLSISGLGGGPSLFDMMELLGQETCVRRLRTAAETLR